MQAYDALLVLSFGGPDRPDDVMPFLENVLRGRNVPRERLLEVAEHYHQLGGVSPINGQNRALIAAIETEVACRGWSLPVYWGNRNWHPLIADTVRHMRRDGVRRALAFATSAYSSFSSCRQYQDDIRRALDTTGNEGLEIHKLRPYFNHPDFIAAQIERLRGSLEQVAPDRRGGVEVLYTAHSIPRSMADGCDYALQLDDVARTISDALGVDAWKLVYQSRSGSPRQAWLEPDVCDYIRKRHAEGSRADIVIAPIGFISDHMEVVYDLDTQARQVCDDLGIPMVRVPTVGTHPCFVRMVCELVAEMQGWRDDRPACGSLPPRPDRCPADCCPAG